MSVGPFYLVSIPSAVRILEKKLFVVCLSGLSLSLAADVCSEPRLTVDDREWHEKSQTYDNLKHTFSNLCSRHPFRDTLPFGYYPFINKTF